MNKLSKNILTFLTCTFVSSCDNTPAKAEIIKYSELVLQPINSTEWRIQKINSSIDFTGKAIEKYPSGEIKAVRHYKDGVFHGTNKFWFENGQLELMSNYKFGKLHGVHKLWDKNGKLVLDDIVDHWIVIDSKEPKEKVINNQLLATQSRESCVNSKEK